jgi:hypothetical protein
MRDAWRRTSLWAPACMLAIATQRCVLARVPAASRERATLRQDDTPARLSRRRSCLRLAVCA